MWRRAEARVPRGGCESGGGAGPGARTPAPWPRGRPPPARPLRDTPRLAAGHLGARHVLPPRPAPQAPPRAGGGNRRPRPDSASLGGRERGAAGRRGRPGAWPAELRSVGHPRGAPRSGVGRRAESAPRGGRADRLVAVAGRGRPAWEGPVTLGREPGPGLCPPTFPGGPGEDADPGPASRETGRAAEAPLAGRLPGVRCGSWRFSNPRSQPARSGERKRWHFYPDGAVCRLLSKLQLFYFLFSSAQHFL